MVFFRVSVKIITIILAAKPRNAHTQCSEMLLRYRLTLQEMVSQKHFERLNKNETIERRDKLFRCFRPIVP